MVSRYVSWLLRFACSAITHEVGFEATRESCMDLITEWAERYIEEIALNAHQAAQAAGRTSVCVHDIAGALQEMGVSWEQLETWRAESEPLPWAHAVPLIPVPKPVIMVQPDLLTTPESIASQAAASTTTTNNKDTTGNPITTTTSASLTSSSSTTSGAGTSSTTSSASTSSSTSTGTSASSTSTSTAASSSTATSASSTSTSSASAPVSLRPTPESREHIPPWMPLFPDKRTYARTPVSPPRVGDAKTLKKRKVDQNRQIELSLTKLHRAANTTSLPPHHQLSTITNGTDGSDSLSLPSSGPALLSSASVLISGSKLLMGSESESEAAAVSAGVRNYERHDAATPITGRTHLWGITPTHIQHTGTNHQKHPANTNQSRQAQPTTGAASSSTAATSTDPTTATPSTAAGAASTSSAQAAPSINPFLMPPTPVTRAAGGLGVTHNPYAHAHRNAMEDGLDLGAGVGGDKQST